MLVLQDQVLSKKIRLQFLESGYWLRSSGWVRQIIPTGNSHGKGPRKRFCASFCAL